MARIAGVDLPRNKRIEVALTYIFGIGRSASKDILKQVEIDPNLKTDKMTEDEVNKIRDHIEKKCLVEGELRRQISFNIKRLVELGTYRGLRHRKSLPVRGQRTHTNARTRKGPKKTVAVRKQLKVMK
ncbi:MAG: 30S ribosomal protein S13 [Bdellovibrionaceae bacterium]|nr:30S ribosomal protein S13 [Bdellovibrionales bacterium]MCB9253946.1 30S ribosomal protein S13 [Pseudobdellovibrionaceae bacterium]